MRLTRRALLGATILGVPVVLAGCGFVSTSTTNGVTTVTVNVANLATVAGGIAGVAGLLIGVPGVGALLTSAIGATAAAAIPTVIADINGAVASLTASAGAQQTLTFTSTSVPAFASAILTDAQTLVKDATSLMTGAGLGASAAEITQYAQGVQTLGNAIIAQLSALLPQSSAASAVMPPTQAEIDAALALLKT